MVIWVRNNCPSCQTNEHVRYRRTIANGLRCVGNAALFPLWSLLSDILMETVSGYTPMAFVCMRCGARFRGEKKQHTPKDECARCEYNLLGNQTGRCPECGWRIPRAFRRALAERSESDK